MKLKQIESIPENGQFIAVWKNEENGSFWAENYIVVENGVLLSHDKGDDMYYEMSNAREYLNDINASFYVVEDTE